ncbi:phospholipase [Pseudomonas sp. NPDC089534]|uniref:phospholipase n=1 Tax=Pseudomonas sp. NPDC089534 TaxID=3364468 RepID=UPI0037F8DB51
MSEYRTHNWMAATPAIDVLPLPRLSLPGTHNAGCDWKASYPLIPGAHWLACQHRSFYEQLSNGSRALDLRLICNGHPQELAQYRFQHNDYLSSRHLENLFNDVNRFLSENPDEFIIFDFHELRNGKQAFDFAYFSRMLLKHLDGRIIPSANHALTLGNLKHAGPRQRIMLKAERRQELDRDWFGPKINHHWIGTSTPSADDLQKFISEQLKSPPYPHEPWSLSAASYSAVGGPVDIHSDLDKWFDPARSDWAEKCGIINADFIEESRLVEFCRAANLAKARKHGA